MVVVNYIVCYSFLLIAMYIYIKAGQYHAGVLQIQLEIKSTKVHGDPTCSCPHIYMHEQSNMEIYAVVEILDLP